MKNKRELTCTGISQYGAAIPFLTKGDALTNGNIDFGLNVEELLLNLFQPYYRYKYVHWFTGCPFKLLEIVPLALSGIRKITKRTLRIDLFSRVSSLLRSTRDVDEILEDDRIVPEAANAIKLTINGLSL